MKLTIKILVAMLFLLITGLFASNIIMKKEYDKVDKTDLYWTYKKVLQQPFKYLKVFGGNITNIAFEQSADCSVRILGNWLHGNDSVVKTFVKDDTLFIQFNNSGKTMDESGWWKYITPVRIFSPELLAVEGFDTNLGMFKLKQKSLHVSMSGKSKFEVESSIRYLDSITINQKDSSQIIFERSPENGGVGSARKITNMQGGPDVKVQVLVNDPGKEQIKSREAMNIRFVNARLEGNTLLDIGHAQIESLQLNISDSSAVILSGGALKKIQPYVQ